MAFFKLIFEIILHKFGYYTGVLRGLIDKMGFGDAFMDYDESVRIVIPNEEKIEG